MRLHNETTEAEVHGDSARAAFKISPSAKAFSILSSGLYSDKILAIVRELSTNAYDSHVEAGKADVPFFVQLPNRLDPTFAVQDFGVGLDHEDVMEVYTTYFESTKQDSDEYVGALGLGSKSPFSYTDNFLITAVKDGVKRIYSAMVEDGFPTFVKFGADQKTDESNGVRVEFSVQAGDFNKFAEAAQKVYRWFDVLPEIKGNQVRIERCKMTHKNIVPGVDIRETNQLGFSWNDNRPYARQGTVAYPITPNPEDIDEDVRGLLNIPLVIDFPIGSLDVTPSREALSYIKHTNNSINKRFREIAQGLEAYVRRELNNATTDWERLTVIRKMLDQTFKSIITHVVENTPDLFEAVETKMSYGRPILIVTTDTMLAGGFDISEYDVRIRNRNTGAVRLSKVGTTSEVVKDSNGVVIKNAHGSPKTLNYNQITVSEKTRIFVNDTGKKNVLGRVREELKDNHNNGDVFVVQLLKDDALDNLKKALGHAPLEYVSDLSEVHKANRAAGTGRKITLLEYSYSMHDHSWRWNEVIQSIAEVAKDRKPNKVLYVPLKNRIIETGQKEWRTDSLNRFVSHLVQLKIIDVNTKIIGARRSVQDNLTSDYVNLFDYVRAELKKVCVKTILDHVRKRQVADVMKTTFDESQIKVLSEDLPIKHPLRNIALVAIDGTKIDGGIHHPSNVGRIQTVAEVLGTEISIDTSTAQEDAEKEWNDIMDKYPMLSLINLRRANKEVMDEVINYINLVDQAG
jgi:hypothetical protein